MSITPHSSPQAADSRAAVLSQDDWPHLQAAQHLDAAVLLQADLLQTDFAQTDLLHALLQAPQLCLVAQVLDEAQQATALAQALLEQALLLQAAFAHTA